MVLLKSWVLTTIIELRAMNVNLPETVLDAIEGIWEGASGSMQAETFPGELGGGVWNELWFGSSGKEEKVPVKNDRVEEGSGSGSPRGNTPLQERAVRPRA